MFPKWRMNSTAAEKLAEMAQYAEMRPDSVKNIIVIYENSEGARQLETDAELSISHAVYLLEQTKFDLLKEM